MSKIIRRSKLDEQKVAEEFASLFKKFRPIFGDEDNIRITKMLKPIGNWERLIEKNKGLKNEAVYRKKLYDDQKIAIKSLTYYFNKQNGNVQ